MEKLMLLSTFVFILVSASAQSDVTVKSYNEETPFTFRTKYPSTTLLAYWICDRNANFSIEFEGLSFRKYGHLYSSLPLYPQGWRAWHFVSIRFKWISNGPKLQIYPGDISYPVVYSKHHNIRIQIKSKIRIYWQQCFDFFSCDLSCPECTATECITESTPHGTQDSTMDLTTLLLIGTSCLLAVIVVGLVAYIIRLKKSTFNEARSNTKQETYEEIQMSRNSGNSPKEGVARETVNSVYGVIIPSGERP